MSEKNKYESKVLDALQSKSAYCLSSILVGATVKGHPSILVSLCP